jgi:HSP20 family protein
MFDGHAARVGTISNSIRHEPEELMFLLFRFDPFEELDRMASRQRPALLSMDAVRSDDEIFVYLDAPGVAPDELEVTTEANTIIVTANRRWFAADDQVLASERSQGRFRRQIQVGDSVDLTAMAAELEHGVLTLRLPIRSELEARSVPISVSSDARELHPVDA